MLKKLSDKQLLNNTQALVDKERKTLKEILEHLQEIFDRRLFADFGHSSLFKYIVKELKYSEGAAARRIGALRLMKKVPTAKRMISSGELSLTVASQTQSFCKDKDVVDTEKILQKVRGKTKDEATVELLKMSQDSTAAVSDRKVRVSPGETRVHLTVCNDTLEKLEMLKDYKNLNSDMALNHALELALNNFFRNKTGSNVQLL